MYSKLELKEIKDKFRAEPAKELSRLFVKSQCKWDIRAAIADILVEEPESPVSTAFFWLMFMPRRLSVVSVDGRCNLACRMCGGSTGKLNSLPLSRMEKMLQHVPTTEIVTFVSGNSEPLMNPEIAECLKLINKHNALWDIVTNGHLLNDKLIEAMIPSQLPSRINVSLDACFEETYQNIRGVPLGNVLKRLRAFRDARDAVKSEFPLLSLLMVGMEDNIAELPEFIKLAAELKAHRVLLTHMLRDYTPGDFFKNSRWRKYVLEALLISKNCGVRLELPRDVNVEALLKNEKSRREEKLTTQISSRTEISEDTEAPRCTGKQNSKDNEQTQRMSCPWMVDVHVQLNGNMNPCCNTTAISLGNIYEMPLHRNHKYLDARMDMASGKIFKACLPNLNCAYVDKLKQMKSQIEYTEARSSI